LTLFFREEELAIFFPFSPRIYDHPSTWQVPPIFFFHLLGRKLSPSSFFLTRSPTAMIPSSFSSRLGFVNERPSPFARNPVRPRYFQFLSPVAEVRAGPILSISRALSFAPQPSSRPYGTPQLLSHAPSPHAVELLFFILFRSNRVGLGSRFPGFMGLHGR